MIREIVTEIARQLVSANSWLSEIRVLGYMQQVDDTKAVLDGESEIGLTDKSGNSGYIRFASDTNFQAEEDTARMGGCAINQRITYGMRMVVAAKTEVPENIALLLTVQLAGLSFNQYPQNRVKVRARQGGTNTFSIVKNESGDETWNNQYKAIYLDFIIQFNWQQNCNEINIETDMICDNCSSILDLGCIQRCEEASVGMDATYTGQMSLKTIFNGVQVVSSFDVVEGEDIQIPLTSLNDDYEFNIQLLNSEGNPINIVLEDPSDSTVYDCVKIKVIP